MSSKKKKESASITTSSSRSLRSSSASINIISEDNNDEDVSPSPSSKIIRRPKSMNDLLDNDNEHQQNSSSIKKKKKKKRKIERSYSSSKSLLQEGSSRKKEVKEKEKENDDDDDIKNNKPVDVPGRAYDLGSTVTVDDDHNHNNNNRVHDDFTITDYVVRPPILNLSNNSNSNSTTSNNKRKKKKKNNRRSNSSKRSDIDPDGYSSTKSSLYGDDDDDNDGERNPLRGGRNDDEGEEAAEECELMDDTFTFLMTAAYPLESFLCSSSKKKNKNDNDNDDKFIKGEEEVEEGEGMLFMMNGSSHTLGGNSNSALSMKSTNTTTNAATEGANPDQYCIPFWLGSFVIFSQLFIYTIVIANLFKNNEIPPNADLWLRLAQVFAVFVTLYTQSDFIDGIFLFTERWKAFSEITGPIKFNISASLRVLAGTSGIFATFVLVMYSEEVVDLLLNFTAMEFVATLDGSAFELAAKGFLGAPLEKKSEMIRAFRYKPRHSKKRRRTRFILYFFCFGLVFAAFFVAVGLQENRQVGIDNEIYVQFDDTDLPDLYGISGVYKGCNGFESDTTTGIGYVDVSDDCPDRKSNYIKKKDNKNIKEEDRLLPAKSFVYCRKSNGWVHLPKQTKTPCEKGNYLIRSFLDEDSIPSNAFDILTHSKANWVIHRSDIGGESILTNFVIESVKKIQSDFTYCNDGTSLTGLTRIDKKVNEQRTFEPLKDEYYPKYYDDDEDNKAEDTDKCKFEKDGNVYGCTYKEAFGMMYRPLYYRKVHEKWEEVGENSYQVVLFDGLRWNRMYLRPKLFATHIGKEKDCGINENDPGCWLQVFLKYFHTQYAAKESWMLNTTIVAFDGISEPMMLLSTTDTGQPTKNLRWYESRLILVVVDDVDDDGGGNGDHTIARIVPGQEKEPFQPSFGDVSDDYSYYGYNYNYYGYNEDDNSALYAAIDGAYTEIYGVQQTLDQLLFSDDVAFGFECDVVDQKKCKEGQNALRIDFSTDDFPDESRIFIFRGQNEGDIKNLDEDNIENVDAKQGSNVFQVPKKGLVDIEFEQSDANTDHILSTCAGKAQCIQVVVLDTFGDGINKGYTISYGDEKPVRAGNDGGFQCRAYGFGSGCKESGSTTGNTTIAETMIQQECDYNAVIAAFQTMNKDSVDLSPVEEFFGEQMIEEWASRSPAPTSSGSSSAFFDDYSYEEYYYGYDTPTATPTSLP